MVCSIAMIQWMLDDSFPCYCGPFFIQLVLRFFAILIAAAIANPYSLIIILGVVIGFLLLRAYYLRAARDVKRLEALGMCALYMYVLS